MGWKFRIRTWTDVFSGRFLLRWDYFKSRWNNRDTNIWMLLGVIYCTAVLVVGSWARYQASYIMLIALIVFLELHRRTLPLLSWRAPFIIGGPLPIYYRKQAHYIDIWQTQLNSPTEQYREYYNYIWTHWHEMEERILLILTARNLLLGI